MEPKKKLKKSKKKLFLILIPSIIVVVAGIIAFLILVVFKKPEEPEVVITDIDILSANAWEKQDAPTVIWTLKSDGTGEITTNKKNYYSMKWSLEGESEQTLKITTSWLYELEDSFIFKLNREENYFVVKNLSDETESTFVPLGTTERRAAQHIEAPSEESTELEKTEE